MHILIIIWAIAFVVICRVALAFFIQLILSAPRPPRVQQREQVQTFEALDFEDDDPATHAV
jgi:hypothetical protein